MKPEDKISIYQILPMMLIEVHEASEADLLCLQFYINAETTNNAPITEIGGRLHRKGKQLFDMTYSATMNTLQYTRIDLTPPKLEE